MADSASAPAPAPATGRGRPASAAPGPIELADEKTVQTLATPDSFGAPLARLSPSPTGHGYGSTPPSASTARRGARIHSFFLPPTRAHSTTPAPRTSRYQPRPYHDLCPRWPNLDGSARELRSAQVYGINTGRTLRSLIPPYRLT